ncbi:hypothetical protein ACFQY5_36285 [Paeniroseomonas aquatica]|uniref:hypothetical protein n=1 Tax=Paeniroseomonas aquatica TaxID=373043 RepID=UPI00361D60AD
MRAVLADLSPDALGIAEAALRACPADSALLLLAALAALVAGQPDRAIGFLKRFERKFEADKAVTLLTALALARKGYTARAWTLLEQDGLLDPYDAIRWFIGGRAMAGWLVTQLAEIRTDQLHEQRKVRQGMPRAATGKPTGRPAPVRYPPGRSRPRPSRHRRPCLTCHGSRCPLDWRSSSAMRMPFKCAAARPSRRGSGCAAS